MAISPNSANSNVDTLNYSQSIEKASDLVFFNLGKASIKDILNSVQRVLPNASTKTPVSEALILNELQKKLDLPILKGLAQDTIAVVSNWFEDPQVLCCLIQGIWSMFASTQQDQNFKGDNLSIAGSSFGKWLDVLISFVDLIIVFLSTDVKKISIIIPDFIKEITNGVIGAILLVLQEVLFTLRDSTINGILKAIDRAEKAASFDMENIWAKCLPFSQLLEIVKKYVSDYGLFAELFTHIKGYVSKLVGDFGYMKKLDFPKNVADLEFLYWFRDLLIKLKQASINFDLCVLYGSSASGGAIPNQVPTGLPKTRDPNVPGLPEEVKTSNPQDLQGFKVASDGTILTNKDTQQEQRNNTIPLLSNSSIRTFLNKYYGYPLDVVDNLLTGSSSADSIQGSNINAKKFSNINADCPNTPKPEDIVRWALGIRNRNL